MVKTSALLFCIIPFLIYGQTANFWTKKNDFSGLKRARAVAFTVGDFAYIATGEDTADSVHNDLWQYNVSTDTWSQKASLPGSKRRNAIAFSIGQKAYVGTGVDSSSASGATILNDFWEYTPALNQWVQKADFPGSGGNGLYFATGFAIGSKGYLCCGKVGPNNYSKQLWEYKPANDEWIERANFPGGVRYQLSSFTIGSHAYVGLGEDQDTYRKDFWQYNPATNQWMAIPDLPGGERGGASTFTLGSWGHVCLGANGGFLEDHWAYNPGINDWIIRAPYGGSERKNAVSFVVNNTAFVGTGSGYSGKKASIHQYTPSNYLDIPTITNLAFSIYPNPAKDFFTLQSDNPAIDHFDIICTSGKKILEIKHQNKLTQTVQNNTLQTGIYTVIAKDVHNNTLEKKRLIYQ
jgi:N-acetylneuraminic acid mutarotase